MESCTHPRDYLSFARKVQHMLSGYSTNSSRRVLTVRTLRNPEIQISDETSQGEKQT